ncbi:MAG: ATP synthase subunit I [Candidatus Stygibacter frigidus]|nr:ATP synthase subunit I [Candidatus Stygibacter frigidus]
MLKNKEFIVTLMRLISLTNIITLIFLPLMPRQSLSWICGATLSLLNVWLMSLKIEKNFYLSENKAKLTAYKDFNLRYVILIAGSILAVKYLNLNIIIFGVGLLSGQIWIFILYLIRFPKDSEEQE